MKTYIFSNCRKTDLKTYEKNLLANVPRDARIIILNKGEVYYQIPGFKNYPNQNLILRSCGTHGLCGFFGFHNVIGREQNQWINDIICFRPVYDIGYMEIGHKDNSVSKFELRMPWMVEYHNATGKEATTGYAAYYLVQDIYNTNPDDIFLVNFYGNNDTSTCKWDGHAWNYEDQWLKDKQRIYC